MSVLPVRNLNKRFGGLQALGDVNFEVQEGEVYAIIGPNGAGKSTLLNCLVGLLSPDSGSVTFNGQSLLGLAPHKINQAVVARVFQTPEIFADLTLLENATIPALSRRDGAFAINAWNGVDVQAEVRDHAEEILLDMELADKKDIIAGTLSRGDKRRLELAMCLVQDPKLLLLDEPTAGMSPQETAESIALIDRIVDERKLTLLFTEHDMDVVFTIADRISVLHHGAIIATDTPDRIRENEEVQQVYLGRSGHGAA